MLFYCHLSPLKDNKLIISNHLVIIRGDNRVTIAIYHTFYCHLSPSYHILPITYDSMPITYYLLLITYYLLLVTYYLLTSSFVRHDIKHHLIRFVHGLRADSCQVTNALIDIFVNNAFYRSHTTVLHCHHSR